ncbi:MAG: hypothetical protein J6U91_07600 [Alistipes sp.]|nr:hypothetical protein [Alistipes sp.]
MSKTNYISPEITILDIVVEGGYGLSQETPGVNVGIGGWEADDEDYGGDIY